MTAGSVFDYSKTPGSNSTIAGINIAAGCPSSSVGPAIRQHLADIAESVAHTIVAGGTADALTITFTNIPATLTDGMQLNVRAALANVTTTPTITTNVTGDTGHTVTKLGGVALIAGDIAGALAEHIFRYNLANTRWELLNPKGPQLGSNTFSGTQTVTGTLAVSGNATFTGQTSSAEVALPATTGTVTIDLSTGNNFGGTLTGNITLANPSNAVSGQSGAIRFTQDGTGSRTIAFGTNWKFQGGVKPTLSTAAAAVDILTYYAKDATTIIGSIVSNVS